MKDLERRIQKLEQKKNLDSQLLEELDKYFDEEGLSIIERVGTKLKLGLVKGEIIGQLIREGARKSREKGDRRNVKKN